MVTFRSKIALVIVLCCSMVLDVAQAMTFSPLHVHSRLGEPLLAETLIQLSATEEPEQLTVRAAASDVYASSHLEFSDALLGIHYQLEKKDEHDYVLHITSQQPIDDPLLTTLVEFVWNGGKLLREVTLILDPADYSTGGIHPPAVDARSAMSLSSLSGLNLSGPPVVAGPRHVDFNSIFDNSMINDVVPSAEDRVVASPASTLVRQPSHASFFFTDPINIPVPAMDQAIPVPARAQPIVLRFSDDQGRSVLETSAHAIEPQSSQGREHAVVQEIFDISSPKTSAQMIHLESVKHNIYIVKNGESIYSVARRYPYAGISTAQMVSALRSANPHLLPKQMMLQVGDVIIIPTRNDVQGLEANKRTVHGQHAAQPHHGYGLSERRRVHFLETNEVKVQRATVSHDGAVLGAEDVVASRHVRKNAYATQDSLDQKIRALEARVDQQTINQGVPLAPKIVSSLVVPQAASPAAPLQTVTSNASLDFVQDLVSHYGVFGGGLLAIMIVLMMVWKNWHRFFHVTQKRDVSTKKKAIVTTQSFPSAHAPTGRRMPLHAPGVTMSEIMTEEVTSSAVPVAAASSPSFVEPQEENDHQLLDNHVDSVAEAEVYMAYGRLQQAEDLLVDALQKDPNSASLSMKLLDVLHQQKKLAQFNKLAATFQQTDAGQDPVHWEHVVQMGLTLDPQNALYQSVVTQEASSELPPLELSSDDRSIR